MSSYGNVNDLITALSDKIVILEGMTESLNAAHQWGNEQVDFWSAWDAADPRVWHASSIKKASEEAETMLAELSKKMGRIIQNAVAMREHGKHDPGGESD